jgi:nucleoside-triphosphatase THEP1
VRDVHARRNRSRIGFRLMTFASSSLQILARVSFSSHLVQSKGAMQGLSGELGGAAGVK